MPSILIAPKGGREVASSRYRIHDLVPLLEERGWSARLLTPSMHRAGRHWRWLPDALRSLTGQDVLLAQRPGWRREHLLLLRIARKRSGLLVLDLDDPPGLWDESRAWSVAHADLILAGSWALVDELRSHGAQVEHLTTALATREYDIPRPANDPPVVGWVGDGPGYHDSLLRMLRGVVTAETPWRVRIVGTRGDARLESALRSAAAGRSIELVPHVDWEAESAVAQAVAAFDVGLAPLRTAEGASFKTVQYLAAGVVPIAEAGGEAERHVRLALGQSATIVSVEDPASVGSMLDRLADTGFRAACAERGREAARRHYDRESVADRLDYLLRQAISDRGAHGGARGRGAPPPRTGT